MTRSLRWLPALAALACLAWLGRSAIPPRDVEGGFKVQAFARLPIVYQGRVKPYDTLARNSLVIISERQTWRDEGGARRPAVEWLLDVMSGSPRAAEHRVFRIHNHQLLSQLGLERRPGYRYSYGEFAAHMPDVEMQAARISRIEAGQRDAYESKLLEFWQAVVLYRVLGESHDVSGLGDDPRAAINALMTRFERLERFPLPHGIPPTAPADEWKPMLRSVLEGAMTGSFNPAIQPLVGMLGAWARGDAAAFNADLAAYQDHLAQLAASDDARLRFETTFNHLAPFYRCAVLYVFAFLASCLAWLGWADVLRRVAFWLLASTFLAHTLAIAARVYVSGYPPITNLYGTAVFIGWAGVLLGLILEKVYPLGVGSMLAAVTGFITLLIAHFLSGDGDTMEMMQAVLDTRFWLATHVVIINFGYSATFLAGGLAVLYILRGVLTRTLDQAAERAIGRMMYGVVCFALLLSFLGTVLGGLWADDSWGRFWGWDPKENGALMIVLWNALILHARWGGLVRTRGIAVLSVFGSIVTAWSWFGVNQLGVGLHSYGFTDSVAFWLLVFVASQLAVMGLGLLPRRWWRSPVGRP